MLSDIEFLTWPCPLGHTSTRSAFVRIFLWFSVLLPKIWVPFPWGDHLACPTASVPDSISSTWGLVTKLSPGLAALTAHLSSGPIPHSWSLSNASSTLVTIVTMLSFLKKTTYSYISLFHLISHFVPPLCHYIKVFCKLLHLLFLLCWLWWVNTFKICYDIFIHVYVFFCVSLDLSHLFESWSCSLLLRQSHLPNVRHVLLLPHPEFFSSFLNQEIINFCLVFNCASPAFSLLTVLGPRLSPFLQSLKPHLTPRPDLFSVVPITHVASKDSSTETSSMTPRLVNSSSWQPRDGKRQLFHTSKVKPKKIYPKKCKKLRQIHFAIKKRRRPKDSNSAKKCQKLK